MEKSDGFAGYRNTTPLRLISWTLLISIIMWAIWTLWACSSASRPAGMQKAFEGVHTAYYMIHSLVRGPAQFEAADLQAAANFREAAETMKIVRPHRTANQRPSLFAVKSRKVSSLRMPNRMNSARNPAIKAPESSDSQIS